MIYKFESLTNVGQVRKANEDNYGNFKTKHGDLLIVCDGMGGHVGGAVASDTAVKKIHEYIESHDSITFQTLLYDALVFANHQVFGMAENQPELKGMGTTAVVVLISESGLVYHAHVGDSRLYLLREKGIKRITKDHSLVQLLVDQGQITEDEMETHPNKNQILKAIGTDFELRPEVCKEPLQMKEEDILLICSDGLCGMVHDRDIARITYANISNLDNATHLLIDEANKNGGKDNITATLVAFGQPKDQKVVMTAATVQNTESPKNSKNWLLYGGMAVLLLALVGFLVWGRGTTEQTYCECYETLADQVNNQQTDSLKVSVYDIGVTECEKIEKKDKNCISKEDLEKTIAPVKEREAKRLEKEKGGKDKDADNGKDGKDTKDPNEGKKEEQKKKEDPKVVKKEETKTATKEVKNEPENKTSDDCGKKIPYKPADGEGIQSIVSKHIGKCTGISKETIETDLENKQPQFNVEFKITCKCKDK